MILSTFAFHRFTFENSDLNIWFACVCLRCFFYFQLIGNQDWLNHHLGNIYIYICFLFPTTLEQMQVGRLSALKLSSNKPQVLKRNSNGTYDLDCKPGVMPEKVRKVKAAMPLWVVWGAVRQADMAFVFIHNTQMLHGTGIFAYIWRKNLW